MTVALSLSRSLSEVGALVALACLFAIALLTLIFFVQGKELRRLREAVRSRQRQPLPQAQPTPQQSPPQLPLNAGRNQPSVVVRPRSTAAAAVAKERVPPLPVPPPPAPAPATAAGASGAQATAGRRYPPPPQRLPDPSEFRFLREEGPDRRWAAAVAAVAVVALGVAVALASGSGNTRSAAESHRSGQSHRDRRSATAQGSANSTAPGALNVTVLNSTEIAGLAHRLASRLQEAGYSHARALFGRPGGRYTTSVVEYAGGYRGAAERVARALALEGAAVKPLEGGVAALASGAPVVVVAAGEAAGASSPSGEAVGGAAPEAEGSGGG